MSRLQQLDHADDLELAAAEFGERAVGIDESIPLMQVRNGHIFIYQGTKEPAVLTPKQFWKMARDLLNREDL